MILEPKIRVVIRQRDRQHNIVTIESERKLHVSRVFHNQPLEQTLTSLPLLFNICGVAQSCAAVSACERALDMTSAVQGRTARVKLLCMETVREHLWRIFLDWPRYLGLPEDKEGLAQLLDLQKKFSTALGQQPGLFLPGGANCECDNSEAEAIRQQLLALIEQRVLGVAPQKWLDIRDENVLLDWSRREQTPSARLISMLVERGWMTLGSCEVEALGPLPYAELAERMNDELFIEEPDWQGGVKETTPLTRVANPLLELLKDRYGNGLLSRLVARLQELCQLSVRLTAPDMQLISAGRENNHNAAIAQVEAARGRLVHRVEIENDRITGYQILAPTEWNFHPHGVVAQSLDRLSGSADEVKQQADLLIGSIDPCVAYDLHVEYNR